MYNEIIISNLLKLKEKLIEEINNNPSDISNKFKLKTIINTLSIINNYDKEITLDNVSELLKYPGIGRKTIDKIIEIINTGTLEIIKNYKSSDNKELLELFKSIVSVGTKTAIGFIKKGILSIDDLKLKIENSEIKVNDKIKIGIKYYNKFFGNIPRNEIKEIKKVITYITDNINKEYNLDDNNKYIFKICGSYRRKKEISGDIDILISKYSDSDINHLQLFVNKFKENQLLNNKQPLIIDDITNKNYKTKYMGFIKYKNNLCRRIDIRYVPWKWYYSALLYFTGSAEFNKELRKKAKIMGYKLSEYGLTNISTGEYIKNIDSEEFIFKFLNVKYIKPYER